MQIKLSDKDREILQQMQYSEKNKKKFVKITVLLNLDRGLKEKEIANFLGIDISTIYRYISFYKDKGLDLYLESNYNGYWGKLSSYQISLLRKELKSRIFTTSKEICDWIKETFNIEYTTEGLVPLLHRVGFSYKKTKQVPCEANKEAQENFIKDLRELTDKQQEENSVFYFIDGVHPTHNTRALYGWIETGKEFELPTVSGRDRVNINGAVNAHKPEEVQIVESDKINAQSTKELYQKLIDSNPDKDIIYVIADNAKYYRNKELKEWILNTKIKQVFLPPYSPNLNIIERLWKFMRKKAIDPVFYRTKEVFRAGILSFFENIAQYKQELESLLTLNFHVIDSQFRKALP